MLAMFAHAWRSWKNAKTVAILAIIALAIGIGCATAIFTVVNAAMLRPVPYAYPDRWVTLFAGSTRDSTISSLSVSDLAAYQRRMNIFDVFGYYNLLGEFNLSSGNVIEHIAGVQISPTLLDNAGVRPVAGRLFQDSDEAHVAMISTSLWNQLGSDPGIIGKSITLNGQIYAVVGMLPAWFQMPLVSTSNFDEHNEVWIPVNPPTSEEAGSTDAIYVGYARLKPGATVEEARSEAKAVAARIVKENPNDGDTYTAALFGLQDFVSKEIRPYLLLFMAAAVLLLLVSCANVAGLLVARYVSRTHEIAMRTALGAQRSHLALQFFFEGCFLSIAAAVLGLAASVGLTRLVLSLAFKYIPRASEIRVDGLVVLFVASLACITAIIPSLGPLWQALRMPPADVLNNGVRASASARTRSLSKSLVVVEIAFAFLLLSITGLLISELNHLRRTWPGFDPDHLLTFRLDVTGEKFSSSEAAIAHQNNLINSLEGLPGVTGAASVNQLPLDGCCFTTSLEPEGEAEIPSDLLHNAAYLVVSPDYFRTMNIPLYRGRFINASDTSQTVIPVDIDESAAQDYWPNRDPIGQYARTVHADNARLQVVGVVGDVRNKGLAEGTRPELYFPETVQPLDEIRFVVRSLLPPASLVPAIRGAVAKVDSDRPIYSVRTMDDISSISVTPQRLSSIVIAFFGLAAFLMASLGIYAVTSYSVRERTVEIGTRMALGAQRRDLLNLVLRDGLRMAGYGIAIGIPAVVGATWLVTRYLQVHHIGAAPFAVAAVLVGGVAIIASLFPAWRATLVSPMVAIRNESESLLTAARRGLDRRSSNASKTESLISPALLTELSGSSRNAESFSEALSMALADLREGLHSQFAILFERVSMPEPRYRFRTASPNSTVAGAIPADSFLAGRLRFHSGPLSFLAGEMDTVLRWAREQSPRRVAEIEELKKIGMRVAVALRTKSEIIGLLLLGPTLDGKTYSLADKELLQICAQQLALMIENARLTDRVVEQEKVRRDVALAAEVQERLLPEKSIEDDAVSIAAFTLPARGVGGDCHDFLELGDNEVGIALADVSGKGIAAALIMAAIQSSLRILAPDSKQSPAELVAKMNSFLYRSTGYDRYATFFYAQLDSERRRLRYVNAGHNPPYLLHLSGSPEEQSQNGIEELKTGGTVIGMFPTADYEEARVELRSGDVILAFTDGVTEALNPKQEEFGEQRLKGVLGRVSHLSVKEIIAAISQELRAWIAEAPQHDDITFIVAKLN